MKKVMEIAQQRIVLYDKSGEQHYDIVVFISKSMRGSDPKCSLASLVSPDDRGEDVSLLPDA